MSDPGKATREHGGEALPDALESVVEAVNELKCQELLVLDVRDVASFTDHMVLCTGSSDRHVKAIVDAVIEKLGEHDVKPLHTEGYDQAGWVLVDFIDFLVNVFTPEMRDFYQLERVWRDAPVLVGERPEVAGSDDVEDGTDAGLGD